MRSPCHAFTVNGALLALTLAVPAVSAFPIAGSAAGMSAVETQPLADPSGGNSGNGPRTLYVAPDAPARSTAPILPTTPAPRMPEPATAPTPDPLPPPARLPDLPGSSSAAPTSPESPAPAAAAEHPAMLDRQIAVLQTLDKITARVSTLEVPVGGIAGFKTLSILVRACRQAPPLEPPESAAFLDVSETRQGEATAGVFRGWMFASSPALSAMEHPVYDVWVIDCKNASSTAPSSSP